MASFIPVLFYPRSQLPPTTLTHFPWEFGRQWSFTKSRTNSSLVTNFKKQNEVEKSGKQLFSISLYLPKRNVFGCLFHPQCFFFFLPSRLRPGTQLASAPGHWGHRQRLKPTLMWLTTLPLPAPSPHRCPSNSLGPRRSRHGAGQQDRSYGILWTAARSPITYTISQLH